MRSLCSPRGDSPRIAPRPRKASGGSGTWARASSRSGRRRGRRQLGHEFVSSPGRPRLPTEGRRRKGGVLLLAGHLAAAAQVAYESPSERRHGGHSGARLAHTTVAQRGRDTRTRRPYNHTCCA
eukprot:scaffold1626_cov372-Prasinococcus_capsulatus_cf.AAC.22